LEAKIAQQQSDRRLMDTGTKPRDWARSARLYVVRAFLCAALLTVAAWCSTAPPAASQQWATPFLTPSPTPTATPLPVPQRLDSIKDIVSVTVPRDRRPRDNDVRFDRMSIAEGLSQSTVECILQDRKGFVWFGSEDGLNRFDGYSFTVFRHDPQESNSLSSNYVRCLLEDQTGGLWIGTWGGGLDRLDPETGQFTHHRHDPDDRHSLSHDNILCLYEDRSGQLWVGTAGGGLDLYDQETGRFVHHTHVPDDARTLSDNAVSAVLEDQWGELWVGTTQAGLNRLTPGRGQFALYQSVEDDPHSLSSNRITAIHEDSEGVLWIGTADGGLCRLDRQNDRFIRLQHNPNDITSLSHNSVQTIYEDRSGVLWIGTSEGGLNRYDRRRSQFIHYCNDPFDPHSLSHDDVLSIYEDRGGVLWIGTFGGGLSKANPANQKFAHYHSDPNDPSSLSDDSVRAILEDSSGVLWVGTYSGGLNRFDAETGQWTHYQHNPDDPGSLSHNLVRSIYEDSHGFLWIGTDGGLDRFDPLTEQFGHYRHDPDDPHSLSHNSVWPIFEDSQGALWVGTMGGGLDRFDPERDGFTHYQNDPDDDRSLSHNTVSCILESYDGVLWIGTVGGGLNRFDRVTRHFSHYRHNPNDTASLSNDRVLCIGEDYRNRLYVGTWGGGLDRLDRVSQRFTHFREKDGLANDVVYGIVEDNLTYLWLSTNRGLSRFTPSSEKFRNYDVSDGLQSNEFSPGAYHMGPSGVVYFGGINGFNAFYPPQVKDNPYPPPIVITAFKKLDQTVMTNIASDCEIELSYTDNFVAFEFAALDYTAPHKNQYLYRLEGFDPHWISAGTRRYQSYSNLQAGEYVFRVKGSNNDGIWNREGLAIYLSVRPPIWQAWWFRGALAALLVSSVLVGYRLRVKSIQARTRELERQVDERTYETERRRLVAEGLREIMVILNSNRSLKESLDYIASQAALLTGAAKAVVFTLHNEARTPAVLGSYGDLAEPEVAEALQSTTLERSAALLRAGKPVVMPMLKSQPRFDSASASHDSESHHAMLGIPITVGGDVYGGLLMLYTQQRSFTDEDLELGWTLVDQAALAIANAQLRERVEQMAAATERSRLARDLHDAVTQTLFSASLIAEVLPATWESNPAEGRELLKELRQLSRGAMAEMRTLLLELRPAALAEATLGDLLRQLAEAVSGRTGTPVQVSVNGQCRLPNEVHVA
jgi:ligand-binding sensor domain-containing protein/signal transduction histidine kinase